MFPEDVLIIEVRLQSDRKSVIGGSEELNKRFDFTPLEVIGVQYDPDKLKYDVYENRSTISGTQSIIASYHNFTMLGEDEIIESANLSYVHEYENPDVLSTVIESVGFEIIGTFAAIPAMVVNAYKRGTVSLAFRKHLHHLFTVQISHER